MSLLDEMARAAQTYGVSSICDGERWIYVVWSGDKLHRNDAAFESTSEKEARDKAREMNMRAALAEARRQGWQLVPVEPTKNQEHDGGSVFDHPSVFMGGPSHGGRKKSTAIYRAMLSSAPSIEEG